MNKFKYKPTRIYYANFIELRKNLDELGDEGWELVDFIFIEEPHQKKIIDCIFKKSI